MWSGISTISVGNVRSDKLQIQRQRKHTVRCNSLRRCIITPQPFSLDPYTATRLPSKAISLPAFQTAYDFCVYGWKGERKTAVMVVSQNSVRHLPHVRTSFIISFVSNPRHFRDRRAFQLARAFQSTSKN